MSEAVMPEEMNVYQNAEARFEVAASKLGLEQGKLGVEGFYEHLGYEPVQTIAEGLAELCDGSPPRG